MRYRSSNFTNVGFSRVRGQGKRCLILEDEHDFRKDREPKSKPRIGRGSGGTFTRARHGTLKGNLQSKKIHETVFDGVRRF